MGLAMTSRGACWRKVGRFRFVVMTLIMAAMGLSAPSTQAAELTLDVLWTASSPEGASILASAPIGKGLALLLSRGELQATLYVLVPDAATGPEGVPLDALLDRHDTRIPLVDSVVGRRPIRDPSPIALAAAPDGTFWIAGESGKGMRVPGWTHSAAYFGRVDAQGTPLDAFAADVDGWSPVVALAPHDDGVIAVGRTAAHGWVASVSSNGAMSDPVGFGNGKGVAMAAAGDAVVLVGIVAEGKDETYREHVAVWTYRDGRLCEPTIVRRDLNDSRSGSYGTIAVATIGPTAYVTSGAAPFGRALPVEIARVDDDGTVAWTRTLPVETCEPRSAVPIALADGVTVACLAKDDKSLSIHRFDREGEAKPVARFDAPCGARAHDDPLQAAVTGQGSITLAGAFRGCIWAATLSLPRSK